MWNKNKINTYLFLLIFTFQSQTVEPFKIQHFSAEKVSLPIHRKYSVDNK